MYEDGILDSNIQDTLVFISDAYQQSGQYIKSNEQLSNILEHFDSEQVSD